MNELNKVIKDMFFNDTNDFDPWLIVMGHEPKKADLEKIELENK